MEYLVIGLIIVCFCMLILIVTERKKREALEEELVDAKKLIKKMSDAIIEKNNTQLRVIHVVYFGRPVDHTGDGFIDDYE